MVKYHLEDLGLQERIILKWTLKLWEGMEQIYMAHDRDQQIILINALITLTKCEKFCDYMNNCQLLNKDFAFQLLGWNIQTNRNSIRREAGKNSVRNLQRLRAVLITVILSTNLIISITSFLRLFLTTFLFVEVNQCR